MMLKTIYKYELPVKDDFVLQLPEGAEILHIGTQYNRPNLWALVDPNAPKKPIKFIGAGTGHPLPADCTLKYLGTAIMLDDRFVFHVFKEE